MSILMK
jgi:hypothetical protein